MKSVAEKGLGKGGGVWGGGKRPFLKRAFPPPQLPSTFLPTVVGNTVLLFELRSQLQAHVAEGSGIVFFQNTLLENVASVGAE